MDPILFIIAIIAALTAGAAVLLPSEGAHRRHHWDEDELQNQLGASVR